MTAGTGEEGARRKRDLTAKAVGYVSLFCLVLILATLAMLGYHEWRRLERNAVQTARTAAFFLAEHASRLHEATDLAAVVATQALAESSWDEVAASGSLWLDLRALVGRMPYLYAIALSDQTGRLRLTTKTHPAPAESALGEEYFTAHGEPGGGIYVSAPIGLPGVQGSAFLLSRRIEAPEGRFRGVSALVVQPDHFSRFYGAAALAYDPTVTLFRGKGLTTLARHSGSEPIPLPAAMVDAIGAAPVAGLLADGQDGPLIAYHRVGTLPMYVSVAVPAHALNSAWFGRMKIYALLGAAALLALLGLSLLSFRWARMEAASRAALEGRIAERTAELTAANREMAALLQEVHHRVKNNLQVIASLLRLQQARVAEDGARRVLQDSIDRVQAMGIVHQLLYSAHELSHIDFGDYLRTLAQRLAEAHGIAERLRIGVEADGLRVDLERAVPLGLLANEILSNSLRHAFPDDREGRIAIRLKRDGDEATLSIDDDGAGLPADFEWDEANTLGFRIVRSLAGQIGGSATVLADGGTRFVLRFPAERAANRVSG